MEWYEVLFCIGKDTIARSEVRAANEDDALMKAAKLIKVKVRKGNNHAKK